MKQNVNEILISASVLSAYWEYGRNDMLDLLMPFLKYSIASTTKENGVVDIHSITEMFKKEFGYFDIPLDVVTTLMKRLSPHTLKKESGKFTLIKSLENEYTDYRSRLLLKKEHQEKVCSALCDYLNENIPNRKFNMESTLDSLFQFFQRNGFFVVRNTEELNELYCKAGRLDYEIARFVLNQYERKSTIFDYLAEMVEGYFVSTALSYQNSSSSVKTRFKKMHCYLDTRIIINALGLHLPQEVTQSSKEFINMLRGTGAEVFCFSHNLDEIKSIIAAYRNCLTNPRNSSSNTLEFFDEKQYTPSDVDTYLAMLERKITSLGIQIVDAPSHDYLSYNSEAHIDYVGLQSVLKEKMRYNPKSMEKAADNDCKSIESILLLRNGDKPTELEKAKCIFVSTSYNLGGIVNTFLGYDKLRVVPIVISEVELSSWLWIRNYSTHKDFPKSQLLLNAMMASEMPSPIFLDALFDKVEKMQDSGQLTAEEAVALRTDLFCRKEIYKSSAGDADELSESTILDTRDKLKKQYQGEIRNKYVGISEELRLERERTTKTKNRAYEAIKQAGEKRYKIMYRAGMIIASIAFAVLLVVLLIFFFANFGWSETSSTIKRIASVIFAVLDVIGYAQLVLSGKGKIKKFVKDLAANARNKAEDKKRLEYSFLLCTDEKSEQL